MSMFCPRLSLFASVEVSLDIQMKHEIALSEFPKNTLTY